MFYWGKIHRMHTIYIYVLLVSLCIFSPVRNSYRKHNLCYCNEEAVLLDSNAALLNNKTRSNRQGSEAITGGT